MDFKTKVIQKRYDGYLATSSLWLNQPIFGLHQFKIDSLSHKIDVLLDDKIRLGKYIERFVSNHLATKNNIKIVAENNQILKEKRTLGELDCLLLKDDKPIHLEIIYKFYLYDDSVGSNEIEHFIGPNRKDALIEKITKLKDKQLPLLYSEACKPYLNQYKINLEEVQQQVLFKAQLFLPYSNQDIDFQILNKDCVQGYYIQLKELKEFTDFKFYIPTKKDWLITPHEQVNWIEFTEFKRVLDEFVSRKFSPLVWIKSKKGNLTKGFVVWWV